MKPVFDEKGIASEPGEIRCFYYDAVTSEYAGWSDEYINAGVSMPANSTDLDPGYYTAGKVSIFTGAEWTLLEDHRGETVYSTDDGSSSTVDYIGEIKAGFTTIAPATPYDRWGGKEWVIDSEAKHADEVAATEQKKTNLMAAAQVAIYPLQDAVDLGIATDEESAMLLAWKKYRVLLMRVDTSKAPDIEWPPQP